MTTPRSNLSKCGNCDKVWTANVLRYKFPAIKDLSQRVEPGGVVPAGECPECGALTYPYEETKGVPLFACGDDPVFLKKAKEALEKRDHADYQCFMFLKELISAVRDKNPYLKELLVEAQEIVEDREDYNDKFLRAMAGRD